MCIPSFNSPYWVPYRESIRKLGNRWFLSIPLIGFVVWIALSVFANALFFQFPLLGSYIAKVQARIVLQCTFNSPYWVRLPRKWMVVHANSKLSIPLIGFSTLLEYRFWVVSKLSIPLIGFQNAVGKALLITSNNFQFPLLGSLELNPNKVATTSFNSPYWVLNLFIPLPLSP